MRVHHFFPQTRNLGDYFVQEGIARMIRQIVPDASFELFNVNSRGGDKGEYGLTQMTVARANREADAIVIGGSNLYEGSFRWPWGVHLEPEALKQLRPPLLLVGLGTGSQFLSPAHRPSARVRKEIQLLNNTAIFSGTRDHLTRDWLHSIGVGKAVVLGDPATFIFNHPAHVRREGHITIAMPPRRFWLSTRRLWQVLQRGRVMFRALVSLAGELESKGWSVVVVCNDPADLELTRHLFGSRPAQEIICPTCTDEYFEILYRSRAVISGRLHTAVAAFSLAIPFVLIDVDQRTRGFIDTYQLNDWSADAAAENFESRLRECTDRLLAANVAAEWKLLVAKRDLMHTRAVALLTDAVRYIG